MPVVYFTPDPEKFSYALEKTGFLGFIKKDDLVAIKLHVGEHGNKYFMDPAFANTLAEAVKKKGAMPFFTDTSTYYKRKRHNAVDHIELAREHGFTSAPFIQSDGLGFSEGIPVDTEGIIDKINIAPLYREVDKVIVLSHATGHALAGIGAGIKNIGMGCATKKGKIAQHRTARLSLDTEKCTGCGICAKVCPYGAAVLENGKRALEKDKETCMVCPVCTDRCPEKALSIENKENVCKALASACLAFHKIVSIENTRYINIAMNITDRCDCAAVSEPVESDIGIFLGDDLVAVDAALLDMLKTDFKAMHGPDPGIQLMEAEKLGLGSMKYELKLL